MFHSAATPNKGLHITVNTDVPWYSMSPSVTIARVEMSQPHSDKQLLKTVTVQTTGFKNAMYALCLIQTHSEQHLLFTRKPLAVTRPRLL